MFELEEDIEQKACDLVWSLLGIEGSKLKILGDTAYPDRLFWIPGGKPLLIEFKRPGEEPEPKQDFVHKKLKKLGYKVEVHTNAIDATEAVIRAVEATRLPKESRKILARARSRCTVLRSRIGQDVNHSGRNKTSNKKRNG